MLAAYGQSIARLDAAGTLYNTYTTAKSILTSATATAASTAAVPLPPNFWNPNGVLEVSGVLNISNRVTGPDTFTFQVMMGSIIAFTSGAINLTTTAHTTIPCWFNVILTCRTPGNGTLATLEGSSIFEGQMVAMAASLADGAANTGYAIGPNTAGASGTGFDSTVVNIFDIWVAQSFSGAGNGVQIRQLNAKSFGNANIA